MSLIIAAFVLSTMPVLRVLESNSRAVCFRPALFRFRIVGTSEGGGGFYRWDLLF